VGGCAVVSDKVQHTRKRALSWARYRQRDKQSVMAEVNAPHGGGAVLDHISLITSPHP